MRVVLLAALAWSLMLAGCAGNSQRERTTREDNARKAARINTELGAGYLRRGEYQVALQKLQRAIAADDSYSRAHSILAILYENIAEPSKAERHHRRAIRLAPDDPNAHNNYGAFLCKTGDYRKAVEHFEKAAESAFYETPGIALTNAGRCLMQIPDYEAAEGFLRRALEVRPEFPDALYALAEINYRQGQFLQARAFLQRFESVSDHSAESLLLGYRIESELGSRREASEYEQQLRRRFPKSASAAQLDPT